MPKEIVELVERALRIVLKPLRDRGRERFDQLAGQSLIDITDVLAKVGELGERAGAWISWQAEA